MDSKVKVAIAFIFGAGAGAGATYAFMRKRCLDEVNEAREYYKQCLNNIGEQIEEQEQEIFNEINPNHEDYIEEAKQFNVMEKPDLSELAGQYSSLSDHYKNASTQADGDYVDYSSMNGVPEDEMPQEQMLDDGPIDDIYIIAPEEYGENEDYDQISMTWFEDKILIDDMTKEIIEDPEEFFPFEFLGAFGQYEDDSVHIRNEKLKADFEVLKDNRKWIEMNKKKRGDTKPKKELPPHDMSGEED